MRARPDRLLSNSLLLGWSIPFVLLALPLFDFQVRDGFWMPIAIATAVAAILLARATEVPDAGVASAAQPLVLPPPRQCRLAVYLFSAVTFAGSVLIIFDQRGALGDLDLLNLQKRYLELIVASRDGERIGTGLSTIGTILRSTVYIAIVALVALSKQSPGLRRTGFAWLAVLAALFASEVATASRTYVVFCVVIAVVAGFVVRHRVIRRLGTLILLGTAAVVLFSVTTTQRFEARGGETDFAMGIFEALFDVKMRWMGQWVADTLGFPVATGLLYMSHSTPEFSRLVGDESSQVALGWHSLYLVFAPLGRLFGMEPGVPGNALAQRPGMWWGGMGDIYLDFGLAFIVVFPAVMVAMTRIAQALRGTDIFTLTVRCLTATMFFCTPFFGVFNTYSFTYLLLLGLAVLNLSMRARRARGPGVPALVPPA